MTWSKFVPCLLSVPSSDQRDRQLLPCCIWCLFIFSLLRGLEIAQGEWGGARVRAVRRAWKAGADTQHSSALLSPPFFLKPHGAYNRSRWCPCRQWCPECSHEELGCFSGVSTAKGGRRGGGYSGSECGQNTDASAWPEAPHSPPAACSLRQV